MMEIVGEHPLGCTSKFAVAVAVAVAAVVAVGNSYSVVSEVVAVVEEAVVVEVNCYCLSSLCY